MQHRYQIDYTHDTCRRAEGFHQERDAVNRFNQLTTRPQVDGLTISEQIAPDATGYNPKAYTVIKRQNTKAKAWHEFCR